MLPIVDKLDEVGYHSLEMWGGATFDSCIRYLNEDPWERLRELKKHMHNTQAQMLLRGQNLVGYRHYPDDVVEKFVTKAYENGIDIFRIFDAVNDVRNMDTAINTANKLGAHVQGTICYTISPVHTTEKYVELAKELEQRECDSLCIKDMAGLLSPHAAEELIKSIKQEVSLPISLHCHCTSGMAPMTYMAACEAGVDVLDTALSPFSGGSSQPPTESMVAALQGTPYDTGLDLEAFTEIAEYFKQVKEEYRSIMDPISEQVDTNVLIYQVPGGMLSNLVSQLKEQNALGKYKDVLAEIPKVRAELGYPPLVTPTSQIVGTQAVLNVVMGERYKMVPKEVKDYVRGLYGQPPQPISSEMIANIIENEEPFSGRPADLLEPEYEEKKKEAEDYGLVRNEEDVLTYILYPSIAPKFLRGEAEEEQLAPVETEKPPQKYSSPDTGIPTEFKVTIDQEVYDVKVEPVGGSVVSVSEEDTSQTPDPKNVEGAVTSSMQGTVLSVHMNVGDTVSEGDPICVIEAMKMESTITASHGGVVKQIYVSEGDAISSGDLLASIV
jgi:pyruvate carboxylase subunit B